MNEELEIGLSELLAEVRRIEVQTNRLVTGVMSGNYLSVFRGSGIEFKEVREYEEGDDPRSVDWNVTARVGRPYVKKYVDERELTVMFLLDLSGSMTGGFGAWSARQTAARVCACLALSAVRNNDKVGLIAFSQEIDRFVPPKRNAGHVLRIVRDCLGLPAGGPSTGMKDAIEFASRVLRRRSILFLLSDFLVEDVTHELTLLNRRHDVIAVRLLTPELTPPDAGLVRLRDPESGVVRTVDWNSARVRAAYTARVEAWRARTEVALRRSRVDRMDVPVPLVHDRDVVAQPILMFFHMRELRGAKR